MRLPTIILAAALALGSAPVAADGGSASSASLASSFGDALNQVRAQNGRGALRSDPQLARAAQAHAEDMARHGYFSHTGRNGSNVLARVRAAGCRGGAMAENIAWGQRSAQDAFSGWMASSGHRTNMLGRGYGAFGLGQAGGYWVIVFADGC